MNEEYEDRMRRMASLMRRRHEWDRWSHGRAAAWYRKTIASLVALVGDDEVIYYDAREAGDDYVGDFILCTSMLVITMGGQVTGNDRSVELDIEAEPMAGLSRLRVWAEEAPGTHEESWNVATPGILKMTATLRSGAEISVPYSPKGGSELGPLLARWREALGAG